MAVSMRLFRITIDPVKATDAIAALQGWRPTDITGASTTYHWLDPELAQANAAEAARQWTVASVPTNAPAVRAAALISCANWIAKYYNALNIPWYNDTVARKLYRDYIVGPPATQGGAEPNPGQTSDIDPNYTYSNNVLPTLSYSGSISIKACNVFNRYMQANNPNTRAVCSFVPSINFLVQPVIFEGTPAQVQPGTHTYDIQGAHAAVNTAIGPWDDASDVCVLENLAQCGDTAAWDGYRFMVGTTLFFPSGTRNVFAATKDYLEWLGKWVNAINTRSWVDVVANARAYAAYRNLKTTQTSGGPRQFIDQILANDETINKPDTVVANDLRLVAAGSTALGAAFAAPTLGISALIGGAIAGISTVASALVGPNFSRLHQDDLGRWRPLFEVGYLAGNIGVQDSTGAPVLPSWATEAPAGWQRPVSSALGGVRGIITGTPLNTQGAAIVPGSSSGPGISYLPQQPAPPVSPWIIVGGIVLLGVGGYAIYRATQSGKSRRSSRSR